MTTNDGPETDVFGVPYQPPDRDEAVAQYPRRSMHKLHIAEWHGELFERLGGELTTADLFDFDTERFLPAQAQADGALIQLAAGFDAFARSGASLRLAEARSCVLLGGQLGRPARRGGRARGERAYPIRRR